MANQQFRKTGTNTFLNGSQNILKKKKEKEKVKDGRETVLNMSLIYRANHITGKTFVILYTEYDEDKVAKTVKQPNQFHRFYVFFSVIYRLMRCQLLTVIMNGTVLIISNMKDIWKICSQMFPWKGNQRRCNRMKHETGRRVLVASMDVAAAMMHSGGN